MKHLMLISSLYGVLLCNLQYTCICTYTLLSAKPAFPHTTPIFFPPISYFYSHNILAILSISLYQKWKKREKNPANSLMYRLVKSEMYTKIRGIMLVVAVGPPCVVHQWWFLLILSHPFFHWMRFNVRGNMKFFYNSKPICTLFQRYTA